MTPNDAAVAPDGSGGLAPDGSGDPGLDVTRLTPSSPVTAAQAAEAVRDSFGLSGEIDRLPGEADDNFALRTRDGRRYVVKVAHVQADPEVVSVQVRVLRHLESVAAELPVQRVVPSQAGAPWAVVAAGPLRGRLVHVTTYLEGRLLRSVPAPAALRRHVGATLASLGCALRGFDDPLVHRPLLWDIAQLPRLRPLLAELPPGADTRRLDEQVNRFTAEVAPRLAAQRTQLVHNDFSPDNLLICSDASQAGAGRVCGILDFGDVTVTALVNDVAVAAANLLAAGSDPLGPAIDLISGYHAVTPLTAGELGLLPDLVLARLVARLVISQWRAARFPGNRAYILRNTPAAREQLNHLLTIGVDEITARVLDACRPEASHA